jgi:predicted nucleic acid-binding protein
LAIEAGRELFEGTIARLCFLNTDKVNRAWILFQQRCLSGWSFTDCTSKIMIDDMEANGAALDEHFQQFGVAILP